MIKKIFLLPVIIILIWFQLSAKTTVDIDKNPKFQDLSLGEGEARRFTGDFQRKISKNGPSFTSSFFLQNSLGYTIGSPHINKMEFGIVLGGVSANGEYFNDEAASETYPAISPVFSLHFGLPFDNKTDIIGKLGIFDLFLTGQKPEFSDVHIVDYRQFSLGVKGRRQLLRRKTLLPFLFNFEGFTVGSNFDLQTGYMGVEGTYDVDMPQTTISTGEEDVVTDSHLEGDYDAMSRWLQFSIAADAIGYFKIMDVFTLYTGFGLALGYSWFGMDAESSGNLKASDDTLEGFVDGFDYESDHMMVLNYDSSTMFHPFPLLPVYLIGLETEIMKTRITFETASNLKNLSDVTLIFGIRYQM